ncbi:helix-turn-helix transcriptional regulator [Chitinophaga tropicalis]|nr:LuxR C-terminal-related transcriptional regulator [Chitinophaga tropicalis]
MSHIINKITISIALILLQGTGSIAQTPADSLNTVLTQKNITPEQKVITLSLLARAKSIKETGNAIRIGIQAVQLGRTLSDAQYIAIAYAILSQVYIQDNDISKCAQAVDSSLFYAGKTESKVVKGMAWYRKSWLENLKGQPKEALVSAQRALKFLEGTAAVNYVSSVYYIIASIYANQYDGPLHKKYAQLCLQTALKSTDYDNLLLANQTLGTYWQYYHMQHEDDRSSLDSAFFYNRNALHLFLVNRERIIFQSTMAIVAINMADLYAQNFPSSYRDSVFHYLDLAQSIGIETHHAEVIANCYGMKSDYEAAAGNYEKAEALLLKGLEVANADSARNLATRIQFMTALSGISEKRGNYREALQYQKQYSVLYTDLYNEEKMNITKELEAKYQAEKNTTALKTMQQTAMLHKRLGYLYIGLALASIAAAIFLFRLFRFRLKLAEKEKKDAALVSQLKQQENRQLAFEKQEAELQARLREEEALRLAAEQQLLQERQERLEKDLLAGTLLVEQKTVLLQTLQKKIAENRNDKTVLTQLNKIIDQDRRLDESMAGSKTDFDNINPDFFDKLKERSANSLSRLDLKHCSYIYLGLTNKEVSQRLGIAPKSILMARYRIKQKLGLGKEEELDQYIRSL